MKNKIATTIIILITIILAGVAIFTAVRLYQLRNQSVSPNAPSSKPKAQEIPSLCGGITGATCPSGKYCVYPDGSTRPPFPDAAGTCQSQQPALSGDCSLSFRLTPVSTPTITPTPTATPTVTPTPTPVPACNNTCTTSSQCPTNLTCEIAQGATSGKCRNAQCTGETSCVCATATPTATPTNPSGTPNSCNGTCGSDSNCRAPLVCSNGFCRNPSCTGSESCACAGGGAPTPAPTLPDSGYDWPTVAGFGLGIFVIVGSMLLAL